MSSINTKQVVGRRTLWFHDFDEVLRDAEHCVSAEYRALGNWSTGQILTHLSRTILGSVEGLEFKAPWYVRLIVPLFKQRFLKRPMPSGFKLPARAAAVLIVSDPRSSAEGLELLRSAISRVQSTTERAPSPIFGRLTQAESDRLQLNHAALHLGFLVPPQ